MTGLLSFYAGSPARLPHPGHLSDCARLTVSPHLGQFLIAFLFLILIPFPYSKYRPGWPGLNPQIDSFRPSV